MSEARALRRLFLNFLASAEAAQTCTSDRSKQWGPSEFALQKELREAKKRVDGALRGGEEVDASGALRALQALVGEGNRYLSSQEAGVVVVEAIGNVARYVSRVLSLLGLTSHEARWRQGKGGENGYGYATPQELAAALVEFRSRVRGAALAVAVKGEEGGEGERLPWRLLAMCDEMRDGSMAGLGLMVKDGSPAVWRLEGKKRLSLPLGPSSSAQEQSPSPAPLSPPVSKSPTAVRVPLQALFKQGVHAGQFSAFDAQGVPTHDAEGKELSKRLRAKLERKWERHRLRLSAVQERGEEGV